MSYPVLEISSWEVDVKRNASGTREKFYVIEPGTEASFLFKIPRENIGEGWAEKVAVEIGLILGLEMMNVTFAYYDGRYGCKIGIKENYDG